MAVLGAAIAALAGASVAGAAHQGFHGTPDTVAGLVAFDATFKNHKPVDAYHFRWNNIPAPCSPSGSTATTGEFGKTMSVDGSGQFQGRGHMQGYPDAHVKVTGQFKHHNTRAVGTFHLHGTIPGCLNADTGTLDWHADKG
jgi:hypothetical protein